MAIARGNRSGELWDAIRQHKTIFIAVGALSAILNVLLLGGSLYLMLVYDSVLPSHSIATLIGLFIMVMLVYLFQSFFDSMRSGLMADVANAVDQRMSRRVQTAMSQLALRGQRMPGDGLGPMRDLEQVKSFMMSGFTTMLDLPWILFFLAVLFALHVWLGVATLIGAIILFSLTLITNRSTKEPTQQLSQLQAYRNGMAENNLRHVELLTALGMRDRMQDRWEGVNTYYVAAQNKLSRAVNKLGGISKVFRMALQSVILTVGALLVIDGQASGGVIFASSILSGRALAPVDSLIANWKGLAAARVGWARVDELLEKVPPEPEVSTQLPAPSQKLEVEGLVVAPPGTQAITVNGAQFSVNAGDAVGIIGPSGAGKTSLGRALIGLWTPLRGSVRLDGATLDQWRAEDLGRSIGYLPQTVELLDGTIAENIARFDPESTSDAVIAAAKAAAVHDLIVSLPNGYDTRTGADGGALSAGQRQRVGLARALYKDPFFVLLDEPNSNLDSEGEEALERAIVSVRQRKGIVIVISHRANVLGQVSHVLFMRGGRMEAFGPRDQVLERLYAKPQQIPAKGEGPVKAA